MRDIRFPEDYHQEDFPPVRNVNDLMDARRGPSHNAADAVVHVLGTWKFIIIQSIVILFWIGINALAWHWRWDPYPFILMNLFLSLEAAYAAPMILMSQNRQAARDRLVAETDFETDRRAEHEIHLILRHLQAQRRVMANMTTELTHLRQELAVLRGDSDSLPETPEGSSPPPTQTAH